MKAIQKNVHISPKKANLVAGLVRGVMVSDALNQLKFTPKKAAGMLYKIIHSAAANAENNFKQNFDSLYVKEIVVTKGVTYKRGIPISKGRMHPRLKRSANITVMVDVMAPKAAPSPKPKAEAPAPEESNNKTN